MLDLKRIREAPERLRKALADRRDDTDVDALLDLDRAWREAQQEVEELRAEKNRAGEEIARRKRAREDASEVIAGMQAIGERQKDLEVRVKALDGDLRARLLRIPNIPDEDVPVGADAGANAVADPSGPLPAFSFEPRSHHDLGVDLGILDFERGARLSGSFWPLYLGAGARLQRSLINFFLDLHAREHGYREAWPPFAVTRETMTGTGQLPKFEEDLYRCEADDLFLIPTAEVPVTNIHRGEVLPEADLPLDTCAYTPCFRREAGTYGKDTKGLVRLHQFEKVELVRIVVPERSPEALEELIRHAEEPLRRLGLVWRRVLLATGDLGFGAAKTVDLEVWAPGMGRWLEVSSCTNFRDFQARRLDLRYREEQGKPRLVHTLNGSGLALPRTIIALLETCQQADGSVLLPEVLRPYMGVEVIRIAGD